MRHCLPSTFVLTALLATSAPLPASEAGAADRAFAERVAACEAASHQSPHPFMRDFAIEHAVTGETDGTCGYTQSMPGGMRMECALSEAGRDGLAAEFREMAEGRMSGSSQEKKAWTGECEIVTADGKRLKVGPA
ncbi:MAG: hypothetical protein ABS41_00880 [Arenimonas sp. SCN 70-307]|uniref:hypothetical protein n=1 Tax=Arenimonas sp. SCN 70-307 TaxID=1660089 RepID=UPI000869CF54|nr:hypothetical protein [Arenimonas sp. SCN 70-307]ODS64989.1 MAG: hypothetical protein ABS41_00880 [Arenimonas sp. SCN 70-307]